MKTLKLLRKPLELSQFKKRSALESDCSTFIDYDLLVTENGSPRILYKKLDIDTAALLKAVRKIKYEKNNRTTGLVTESAIFGYNPRNVIRKDFCSATSMAYNHPSEHALIADFGRELSRLYQEYFPDIFGSHAGFVNEKISPDWKIKDTPFTSGIVNRNNPLKYHLDSGNVKNVLSNMVVLKKDVQGGGLACPEFDLLFECANNTVMLFDGQQILHGVTPIHKTSPNAFRYSVVYYTLLQMWQCLPIGEEIARIRKIHTQRERNRAAGKVDSSQLAKDA